MPDSYLGQAPSPDESLSSTLSTGTGQLPISSLLAPISTSKIECVSPVQGDELVIFRKFLQDGIHYVCNAQICRELVLFFEQISQRSKTLVMVLAALQLLIDNGPDVASLAFIDRAVGAFRNELAELRVPRSIDLLACGLFTCTICILQAQPFTQYLKPLAEMYDVPRNCEIIDQDLSSNPISWHLVEVLGVMDLPSFVVGRRHPSLGTWKRVRSFVVPSGEAAHGRVEVVTGMPRDLLDIFADIWQPEGRAIARFWNWQGTITDPILKHRCNSWRYAGILDARRRHALWASRHQYMLAEDGTSTVYDFTHVFSALLSSLDAFCMDCNLAGHDEKSFLNHGLLYPIFVASLETRLLEASPSWKQRLDNIMSRISDGLRIDYTKPLFELLDEAWACRDEVFDIELVAYRRGIEIALF